MRVLLVVTGLLLLVLALVVWAFALLPANAPDNATELLGFAGFLMLAVGWWDE